MGILYCVRSKTELIALGIFKIIGWSIVLGFVTLSLTLGIACNGFSDDPDEFNNDNNGIEVDSGAGIAAAKNLTSSTNLTNIESNGAGVRGVLYIFHVGLVLACIGVFLGLLLLLGIKMNNARILKCVLVMEVPFFMLMAMLGTAKVSTDCEENYFLKEPPGIVCCALDTFFSIYYMLLIYSVMMKMNSEKRATIT